MAIQANPIYCVEGLMNTHSKLAALIVDLLMSTVAVPVVPPGGVPLPYGCVHTLKQSFGKFILAALNNNVVKLVVGAELTRPHCKIKPPGRNVYPLSAETGKKFLVNCCIIPVSV